MSMQSSQGMASCPRTHISLENTALGMAFPGPSPESIEAFGLKHTVRIFATKEGVSIAPGSQGLVKTEDEAINVARKLGFPGCLPQTLA